MKKTALLSVLGLLISGSSIATTNTFDVTFDVQDVSQELAIEEVAPISFPTIFLDESIKNGAWCATHDTNDSALCKDTTAENGERTSGQYRITGTKNMPISIATTNFQTVINGFQLWPAPKGSSYDQDSYQHNDTIGTEGFVDITIYGYLKLVDKSQVTAQQTTLSFDITASYN